MDISQIPKDKIILLFDGVCNLCDGLVQYVIKHDKKDIFRFDSLQSENGRAILKHLGVDPEKMDSMVVYVPGKAYYVQSDAALEIGKHVGWKIPVALAQVFPKSLRDTVYRYVARNRYKWYGKKDQCMLPTPEIRAKFLR
ncbi:Thiol-disulfide oxidoreductase [Flavobacterium longum]|uniref:thiol-disulfide oxidoreductase DCC family protein n=1 Tax=Flavobacterium longum TaxID=1299340 RepID=UPI0039E7D7CF